MCINHEWNIIVSFSQELKSEDIQKTKAKSNNDKLVAHETIKIINVWTEIVLFIIFFQFFNLHDRQRISSPVIANSTINYTNRVIACTRDKLSSFPRRKALSSEFISTF